MRGRSLSHPGNETNWIGEAHGTCSKGQPQGTDIGRQVLAVTS